MPGGDGTGPMGYGPQTGRGAGFCSGFGAPGTMNRGPGLGRGFGGRGRGFRNRCWTQDLAPTKPVPQGELQALKEQAGYLEQSLEEIRKRLAELDTGAKKDNPQ